MPRIKKIEFISPDDNNGPTDFPRGDLEKFENVPLILMNQPHRLPSEEEARAFLDDNELAEWERSDEFDFSYGRKIKERWVKARDQFESENPGLLDRAYRAYGEFLRLNRPAISQDQHGGVTFGGSK
jgi:hypothetical protein